MKIKQIFFMRVTSKWRGGGLPKLADMLRYDCAFQNVKDSSLIAFPTFHTKDGNLGGNITLGRWDSFGVRLTPVEDTVDLNIHAIRPLDWASYRHPWENGRWNYEKLSLFTLYTYQTIKDLKELESETV